MLVPTFRKAEVGMLTEASAFESSPGHNKIRKSTLVFFISHQPLAIHHSLSHTYIKIP